MSVFSNIKISTRGKFANNTFEATFASDGSQKYTATVTKNEAVQWRAEHKAFWPTVVEIAYAKFYETIKLYPSDIIEVENKEWKSELDKNNLSLLYTVDSPFGNSYTLKGRIGNSGVPALSYLHLTGKPCKFKLIAQDTAKLKQMMAQVDKDNAYIKSAETASAECEKIKPFVTPYSKKVNDLYEKIKYNVDKNKFVGVSFKGYQNLSARDIANSLNKLRDPKYLRDILKRNTPTTAKLWNFVNETIGRSKKMDLFSHQDLAKEIKKIPLEERIEMLKEFVLKDHEKLSTQHTGMFAKHLYCIVGYRETKEGYKYIIIANPHGNMTKIDYTRKIQKLRQSGAKLPTKIEIPQDINNAQGECAMELNHFYKKLAEIDYEYNPEDADKALRNIFGCTLL